MVCAAVCVSRLMVDEARPALLVLQSFGGSVFCMYSVYLVVYLELVRVCARTTFYDWLSFVGGW